jgi:predicted DNA-binding transcriptional regulator AlpA
VKTEDKELLTEREAAELFGRSREWFRQHRWRRTGPPWVKIVGRVFYSLAELRAWFEQHTARHAGGA